MTVITNRSNDASTGGKRNSQPSEEDKRREVRKARFSDTPVSPGEDWRDNIPELAGTAGTEASTTAAVARAPIRAPSPGRLAVLATLGAANTTLGAHTASDVGITAVTSLGDLPMKGLPPRFERELALPAPDGFEWPVFGWVALDEHSGAIREAAARAGLTS